MRYSNSGYTSPIFWGCLLWAFWPAEKARRAAIAKRDEPNIRHSLVLEQMGLSVCHYFDPDRGHMYPNGTFMPDTEYMSTYIQIRKEINKLRDKKPDGLARCLLLIGAIILLFIIL